MNSTVRFLMHFHLFSGICLQNMFSRETSGTKSKYMHVLKVCLFLPFWTIIDDYYYVIVTANRELIVGVCHVNLNKSGVIYLTDLF
jgi:hypothetical protein